VVGDSGSFPGPDWMPKQAHMADLQAAAAAANLLAALARPQGQARFKVELVCIVDASTRARWSGAPPTRNLLLPPLRAMHWAKRAFEWNYLRHGKPRWPDEVLAFRGMADMPPFESGRDSLKPPVADPLA
jgi:sulfide:quinone oxidoreductase